MAKRKVYADEYIQKSCNYVIIEGLSVAKAAKKAKVNSAMLRKWIKKTQNGSTKAKTASVKPSTTLSGELQAKIQQLQDEIAILEKARDILR